MATHIGIWGVTLTVLVGGLALAIPSRQDIGWMLVIGAIVFFVISYIGYGAWYFLFRKPKPPTLTGLEGGD